jgi:CBS domain containing-hemolysin-like protein
MAVELAVALVLVAANGFFVAVEFSVARLRPTQAEEMVRQGRPGAKSAAHAVLAQKAHRTRSPPRRAR